uniref:Uncharacterized protein n=1 Tax=viral metagenome TaxID=1070528 RepID=A0A6M3IX13_9ZZZZ
MSILTDSQIKQLKATRKVIWLNLLADNNLDLDFYHWWTEDQKILERTLWEQADAEYEERKIELEAIK